MNTDSSNPWFAKTPEEIHAAIGARDEDWVIVGSFRGLKFSRYAVSDKGHIRRASGAEHATRLNNSGYVQTSITSDDGKRIHPTMQTLVLASFDPRCADGIPDGLESRHGPAGPECNAWPENLDIGTKKQNAADRPEPGGGPQFPCRTAPQGCPNKVINEGRRCLDCVKQVGVAAAALLSAGVPDEEVAARFGNTAAWIRRLAVTHGGWDGTVQAAPAPPSWWHRVMVTLRIRRADPRTVVTQRDGDSV